MTSKTSKTLVGVALAALIAVSALFTQFGRDWSPAVLQAQVVPSTSFATTTLAANVTTRGAAVGTVINLTSASGISTIPSLQRNTALYVDRELMAVNSVNGNYVSVTRGVAGTISTLHASGATVYIGAASLFAASDQYGGCLTGNFGGVSVPALPFINVHNGLVWNCFGSTSSTVMGFWAPLSHGTGFGTGLRVGSFCTGTAGSAETEYLNGAACSAATTATAQFPVSAPGVVYNLQTASTANATGGTGKDVLTVYKNAVATTLTCTIAAAAKVCSDATDGFHVSAGDVLTFQFVSATSDTAANVAASVQVY